MFELAGLSCEDQIEELGSSVGDVLLKPTRIYVQLMKSVLHRHKAKNAVHGIAHITGGGLLENVSRILPDGRQAVIERDCWSVPPVFDWLQKLGDVDHEEMDRVFNRGLGLVLVVSEYDAGGVQTIIKEQGFDGWQIGKIVVGSGACWA